MTGRVPCPEDKAGYLDLIAPCSLLCLTCTAYKGGVIGECARKLHTHLEGFAEMRGTYMNDAERAQWYAQFDEFRATLCHLGGVCPGCRQGRGPGCIDDCPVPDCARARGVDFCAECDEFPCDRARAFFAALDERLACVWEEGNLRLREIGVPAYFAEKKDASHYQHYKTPAPTEDA